MKKTKHPVQIIWQEALSYGLMVQFLFFQPVWYIVPRTIPKYRCLRWVWISIEQRLKQASDVCWIILVYLEKLRVRSGMTAIDLMVRSNFSHIWRMGGFVSFAGPWQKTKVHRPAVGTTRPWSVPRSGWIRYEQPLRRIGEGDLTEPTYDQPTLGENCTKGDEGWADEFESNRMAMENITRKMY